MLCIVKNGPPMKSRTYASLEFWAEDRRNSAAMLRVLIFLSSLSAPASSGRCVGAEPTWSWNDSQLQAAPTCPRRGFSLLEALVSLGWLRRA